MKYYAVARGVEPGIYTDWPTTQRMISGYSGAVFKSFSSRAEAERYLEQHGNPKQSTQESFPSEHTIIYTDGSMQNGKCGFGIVIITPQREKVICYGPVPNDFKCTNNIAELYAIYIALLMVKDNVVIHTDSNYSIGVLTRGWKINTNESLIQSIATLIKDRNIKFQHVKAHSGIEFNEEADKLADIGREQEKGIVIFQDGRTELF